MGSEPPVRQSIEVGDGVVLSVLPRAGDGKLAMLFVHGLASNARLWDGVAERLSTEGHPSLAVDQRGHGESHAVQWGFDFATLAGDLRRVAEQCGLSPVVAVGQSWGGNVVLELAARHPELVAGVVLVDGGFLRLRDEFPSWEDARTALTPPSFDGATLDGLGQMMRQRMPDWPPRAIEAQLANFTERDDGSATARLRLSSHLEILEHLWEHDPDDIGAALDVPILTVAVDGRPGKRARVESFAESSGSTVQWLEGHHDVHAQQPERVAELLIDFADRLDS